MKYDNVSRALLMAPALLLLVMAWYLFTGFALMGLVISVVMALPAVSSSMWFYRFWAVLLLTVMAASTNIMLAVSIPMHPIVYDQKLFHFDGLLGFQASTMVRAWFVASPALASICTVVYKSLAPALLGALILTRKPGLFFAVILAGVLGFVCYQLVPAVGPAYIHNGEVLPGSPRNAIPSLHTAWVLLIYWALRPHGWAWRMTGGMFVVLTLLATLGLGEHYLIDLVVGVPFALAVHLLCSRRWVMAGAAMLPVVGWLMYFCMSPVTGMNLQTTDAWVLVMLTLAGVVLCPKEWETS